MPLGFRQCYLTRRKVSHCGDCVHGNGYVHDDGVNDCVRDHDHDHGRDCDCTFLVRLILSINFCLMPFTPFFVREV